MKRTLFENVKVLPYTAEEVIDRGTFLSAIFSAQITAVDKGSTMVIEISHCDEETGTFETLDDEFAGLESKALDSIIVDVDETVNVDIDLIGCKRYVKFKPIYKKDDNPTTVTAIYAVALGDSSAVPV